MADGEAGGSGTFAPLRVGTFRAIWSASLISNFGHLILGVAAAWEMTKLTDSPKMVALVQTAMMLPLMLVSVPAGAFADMFDRRKIALIGLAISILSAMLLTAVALTGVMTPWPLLGFCVLIGSGVALYGPAWQASIGELVPPSQIPAAIALGTVSYSAARSIGPALGGALVLAAGAQAAFAMNAAFYVPLFVAMLLWKRQDVPARLPPERIDRAIVSGARYALHAPPVRNIVVRAFLFGAASAPAAALAPLVARDLLGGDAATFGLLLGASGIGAVVAGLLVSRVRDRFAPERAITLAAFASATAIAVVGASHDVLLTCAAMFVAGGASILAISLFNMGVQLSAPRWVTARALSLFSGALTGGIGIGAALWGAYAASRGVAETFFVSAGVVALLPILGRLMPVRRSDTAGVELVPIEREPEVALGISLRSGPVAIEIDYQVDPERAREFYNVMLRVQRARQRAGAFAWTLSRDIAEPARWIERYECPTWGDYLRQRSRFTHADRELQAEADAFHMGAQFGEGGGKRVRRLLERPFGSVRWKADSPDSRQESAGFLGP